MKNPMDNLSTNEVPELDRIEHLLGQFKPHPTSGFQRRISISPWTKNSPGRSQRKNIPFYQLKFFRLAAALSAIVIVSASFIPSIRAIARQFFFSFINASSNQVEIQVNLDDPAELFHFSDPSNFTQSIDQVEKLAGFDIKELTSLPDELELIGAHYNHDYAAVIVLYQADEYKLFLTQRQANDGKDVFSIGSSAQVNNVFIGDHEGEFVAGGWKAVSTQVVSPSQQPDTQVNVSAVWDHDLDQYTLRWQADGYAYELRSIGEGSPSQLELISLADGLK